MSNPYHEAQVAYLRRIDAVLLALKDQLSPAEVAEVRHLIDHGEPAEGMCALAWIIHDGQKAVSPELKQVIRDLVSGLVDDEYMPESFRAPS